MMNVVIGERCSGKTTRLIERSAKEGIYILAPTKKHGAMYCGSDEGDGFGDSVSGYGWRVSSR